MSGFREESLHRIFRSSFVQRKGILGPGDDCASLRPPPGRCLLQTVDQVIAGVHLPEDAPPSVFARKLLRRTLSDLAAAGASPWAVSWTLALPQDWSPNRIRSLARAFLKEADAFGVPVIGGDCSQAPVAVLSCTALGLDQGKVPGRAGAKVGDRILVTGKLGDAVRSGAHLLPEPRLKEGRRLVERYAPHAMMDLSDGLAMDLPRLLQASQVGARVDLEKLPLRKGLKQDQRGFASAAGEGEDYELLVVLPKSRCAKALADRLLRGTGITEIGQVVAGKGLCWLLDGKQTDLDVEGWEVSWE